jgi:hypothetical protein
VRYDREMRERAKREKRGLITIGYVTATGESNHLQGPATPEQIAMIERAMSRLLRLLGKA